MSWVRDLLGGNGGSPTQPRERLLRRLSQDPRLTEGAVEAIARVPRELFVPAAYRGAAYDDVALGIGPLATISAPSMVAEMLSVMRLRPGLSVLEIGAGSGYAAATVAALGAHVVGVELQPRLAEQAQHNVMAAGFGDQVRIVVSDGGAGWPAEAPYDRILVSASVEAVPQAWLDQLAPGGMLVYPEVGFGEDLLVRLTKNEMGFEREVMGRCRFVRMQF
jgi:protein-L-isoaspartate(D-aspartate) O-methyltransferase